MGPARRVARCRFEARGRSVRQPRVQVVRLYSKFETDQTAENDADALRIGGAEKGVLAATVRNSPLEFPARSCKQTGGRSASRWISQNT